jgi:hypothetical protein
MLREYARKAWEAEKEKRKLSDVKKRKRKAKKIEEEIYDLLPKDAPDYNFERNLGDDRYIAIVSLTEDGQTLRFTFDEEDELALLGDCSACRQVVLSRPVTTIAELGQMIETFEPSLFHNCSSKGQ